MIFARRKNRWKLPFFPWKNETQGVKTLMCVLSYLDASLKDYDLINKFFFQELHSGFFYVPGSIPLYSGGFNLFIFIFRFSISLFRVIYLYLQVLYLYIPGSEFWTVFFWVLRLYILGSLPIYSWFYTFTFRVLNLFIPVLFTFIFWVFNTRSIPDSTSWSWTTSRVLY